MPLKKISRLVSMVLGRLVFPDAYANARLHISAGEMQMTVTLFNLHVLAGLSPVYCSRHKCVETGLLASMLVAFFGYGNLTSCYVR